MTRAEMLGRLLYEAPYSLSVDCGLPDEDVPQYALFQLDPHDYCTLWVTLDSDVVELLEYQVSEETPWEPLFIADLDTGEAWAIKLSADLADPVREPDNDVWERAVGCGPGYRVHRDTGERRYSAAWLS